MAAEGRTSEEIAQALFVTTKTIDTHLNHTYTKLGINSRKQLAVALAGERGWSRPRTVVTSLPRWTIWGTLREAPGRSSPPLRKIVQDGRGGLDRWSRPRASEGGAAACPFDAPSPGVSSGGSCGHFTGWGSLMSAPVREKGGTRFGLSH
jgi:hypothetical protein